MCWEWKEKHGGIILEQLKKLGASCDWERTKFTMDEPLSKAVINTFVYFYKKGLIYRGVRMVNWDPEGLTAVSDEEVIHKETKSHLYYLRYFIEENGKPSDKFLTIATTRPETIMADAAICINPNDERYYWAKRRDTDDIIWVRVDVRIVPQLDTGDLFAFYNNWDVTHEKNRDRMMQLIIEFDYDYVEYICLQNGHFEIMAQEKSSMCPSARGTDYDADIRDYLTRVAVTDQLEAHIRAMQTEEIRRNLEAEPLYIQEIDVRESDGSVRRKMIRYTYMDKQMGTVFKSCVDIEDIVTEEKKKQERLERAIEETERANCAKSEFLAHMSHDIRTPMNAIIGMTSVARQECQDDTICGYLDKIKSSSEFLLGLINDMLDISRIESGN